MRPRIPIGQIREDILSENAHVATLSPKGQQEFYQHQAKERREKAMAMNIAELNLSVRTINTLEEFGIFTVAHLLQYSGEELKEHVKNFGDGAMREVYKALEDAGLKRKKKRRKS